MNGFDLLEAVQPSEGWYCVIGINAQGSAIQRLVSTREEVTQVADKFTAKERNVYFAVAKYKTDSNRTKENVLALKSFWVDVDCGPGKSALDDKTGRPKGYETQAEGLTALLTFIKNNKLPTPIFVDSGRGVHAYWPLTEAVPPSKWEPVAAKMRKLCNLQDFYVDGSVFEIARVMRLPGTLNFRCDPPKLATVIKAAEPTPFDKLAEILEVTEEDLKPPPPKRELTALGKALQQNVESSFATIINRCSKGDGCLQLLNCYMERATLSEPRWFDALSVAKFCSDRDTAIHKISEGHPGYEPGAVERKIVGIKGPHTCAEFEKNNPDGCKGCPHFGKITSPIVLGKTIARDSGKPVEVIEQSEDGQGEQPASIHVIPPYPDPFFRGKNGGIYLALPTSDEESEPVLVYEHDLYVVKRMHDPINGDVMILKVHMPRDGVKQFVVTNVQLADKNEIRKILASHGVVCPEKRFQHLLAYLMTSVRELQYTKKAEIMRLQFGWADNDTKFILGDREISKDGVFHSPVSSATSGMADHIHAAGTFEKWKEVFELYGRVGLEPHAFCALSAFGAPLLKFTGQQGAIINVIHSGSGTGKTTVLHMCNSVYGNPQKLCAKWDDTLNAKIMRLGIYNNLPFCVDEITNTTPQEFSTLAYNMSQGRGKDRVKASSNELRVNLTSWATISPCSANCSFYEKMSSLKTNADGEMMRLLEYKIDYIDAIPTDIAKEMFDHQIKQNYGHAGEIYLRWLVANKEDAVKTMRDVQAKLDSELKLTQRERFWSAVAAANITGGLIAKELGLMSWDMRRIYEWIAKTISGLRTEVVAPLSDASAIIGDYIYRNMQNVLVVNDSTDLRTQKPSAPTIVPKGPLLIRYEPDTKKMFLAAKAFKDDCVKYQVNYKETLNQLQKKGVLLSASTKRMSKGMGVMAPGVYALTLDCASADFISVDEMLPTQENVDANREG